MRVDLGKDAAGRPRWAEMHSPDTMPRRVSARMEEMTPTPDPDNPAAAFNPAWFGRCRDTLIAMVITSWDLGGLELPTPTDDPAQLYDLPQDVYDALVEACEDHMERAGFFIQRREEKGEKPKRAKKTSSA